MEILNALLVCCLVAAVLSLDEASVSARRTERVCRPDKPEKRGIESERFLVVANSVSQFDVLANCTVIEGSLRIYWMIDTKESDFQNISFPDLVEITDYLLVYRVSGLVSLGSLFPNLRIIRGQHLIFTFALLVYEMDDLESIGLSNLAVIQNGLVLFEKNPNLCYIETVNWDVIVQETPAKDSAKATFRQNKNAGQCSENCPQDCPSSDSRFIAPYSEQKLCWDDIRCQKVPPVCPPACSSFGCLSPMGPCCHSECLGGCTGPNATDCIACRNVLYNGTCMAGCPPHLYKLSSRRCITGDACRSLDVYARPRLWWKTHNGLCIHVCPAGFTENSADRHMCVPCNGSCITSCQGGSIETVSQSSKFKGCTRIAGYLEIRIISSVPNPPELEENLGEITEVDQYVKIVRSQALSSLYFLKKLTVIGATRMDKGKYALYIFENPNLESLWDPPIHRNLTINDGTFFIHMNRKLCYKRIEQLLAKTTFLLPHNITDYDVSTTSNGNHGDCDIQVLHVEVSPCMTSSICYEVTWSTYNSSFTDARLVLGYGIKYRPVGENEVIENLHDGQDKWTVVDDLSVEPNHGLRTETIDVMPYVRYALFVTTYMVSAMKAGAGGRSPVVYFRTNPDNPFPPTEVYVRPEPMYGPRTLHVSWKPPKKPNGIVTEYWVYYRKQKIKPIRNRDYCSAKGSRPQPTWTARDRGAQTTTLAPIVNQTIVNGTCPCSCVVKPKASENLDQVEMQFIISYAVENMLHDLVFVKSPQPTNGRKRSFADRKKRTTGVTEEAPHRRPVATTNDEIPRMSVVKNETSTYLFDLEPARYYSVEVIACHDFDEDINNRLCSASAMSGGSTLPDDTLDRIKNESLILKAHALGNGASNLVQLSWDEPVEFNETNGHILAYEIEVKEISDNKEEVRGIVCINQTTFHEQNFTFTKEVQAGTYSFRVRLISSLGSQQGEWTPPRICRFESVGVSEGWEVWIIAVLVVSVVVFLTVAVVTAYCVYLKRKAANDIPRDILYASVNPDYWDATEVYVPDEWEVNRTKVKLLHELGQGSFGMVYEGIASGLHTVPDVADVRVAVKTVNENSTLRDRISFLKEASVMKAFNCPHIVKLLGVVSQGQPTLVVMELMANGDLKNYLRQHRPDEPDNNGRQPPTIRQIWRMAAEIADGMAYLAAKKFVHRDLAARNCMVADDTTVKIGDFGMTRDIYETDYYRKGSKGLLPVRWMAPESLKDGVFTSYSDVWSYGVVLWEMATLAAQPYQGLSNEQVLKYVIDANMMEAPEGCPERLFELMLKCWHYRPKSRLSFAGILEHLRNDLNVEITGNFWYFEYGRSGQLSEEEHSSDGDHDALSTKEDPAACCVENEPLQRYVAVSSTKRAVSLLQTSGYGSLPRSNSVAGCSTMLGTMSDHTNGHVHLPLLGGAALADSDSDHGSDEVGCSSSCRSSADEAEYGDDVGRMITGCDSPSLERRAPSDLMQSWPCGHGSSVAVAAEQPPTAPSDFLSSSTINGFMREVPAYHSELSVQCGSLPPKCNGSSTRSKDAVAQNHSNSKSSCNGNANGHITYLPRAAEC